MTVDPALLACAQALEPKLIETLVTPVPDCSGPMNRRERLVLDFGDHHVGYFRFCAKSVGSPMDAPAKLRFRFAELPFELERDWSSYDGEISSSWLQEEILLLDVLPAVVELPRRYAFRYVEISVVDTSPKYSVVFSDISCRSVSSADMRQVPALSLQDSELAALDRVSIRTMHQCMQSVFEDGPKRDRRLWLGDLRLQALVNYETFREFGLVKRCLYLFAALTMNEGQVGACLFLEPKPQVDDTALFDYSLFFVSALHDYYEASGDRETLAALFPTALRQTELALNQLDEQSVVKDRDTWWCFLDWCDGLNKQAGAQAILIYTLKQAAQMARSLGLTHEAEKLTGYIATVTKAAMDHLWNGNFFTSGAGKQISWASQIWFVLADILPKAENKALMERLIAENPPFRMVTPYMYHHYVEALIQCGMQEQAFDCLKAYWGEMIRDGADTFFEVYDPENKENSPYGDRLINSFCHAWSGTPAYFIRKYLAVK